MIGQPVPFSPQGGEVTSTVSSRSTISSAPTDAASTKGSVVLENGEATARQSSSASIREQANPGATPIKAGNVVGFFKRVWIILFGDPKVQSALAMVEVLSKLGGNPSRLTAALDLLENTEKLTKAESALRKEGGAGSSQVKRDLAAAEKMVDDSKEQLALSMAGKYAASSPKDQWLNDRHAAKEKLTQLTRDLNDYEGKVGHRVSVEQGGKRRSTIVNKDFLDGIRGQIENLRTKIDAIDRELFTARADVPSPADDSTDDYQLENMQLPAAPARPSNESIQTPQNAEKELVSPKTVKPAAPTTSVQTATVSSPTKALRVEINALKERITAKKNQFDDDQKRDPSLGKQHLSWKEGFSLVVDRKILEAQLKFQVAAEKGATESELADLHTAMEETVSTLRGDLIRVLGGASGVVSIREGLKKESEQLKAKAENEAEQRVKAEQQKVLDQKFQAAQKAQEELNAKSRADIKAKLKALDEEALKQPDLRYNQERDGIQSKLQNIAAEKLKAEEKKDKSNEKARASSIPKDNLGAQRKQSS